MNRRRFIGISGLGALVALFAQIPAVVASTVESCVSVLEQIRNIALGSGDPVDKLDQIVALVDDEIGPIVPSISGDFAGTIPVGETWRITGDVNLTGDLIVEGVLESVDTFRIEGNGFQILVHHGGQLMLAGSHKTTWTTWGTAVDGWQQGDQLAIAPTAPGTFQAIPAAWSGSWATMPRPEESPDVQLRDGRTMLPEVVNLTKSAVINNVSRIHFHNNPGVQSLRDIAVTNSGVYGVKDFYPIHFHFASDSVRGSAIVDVVVAHSPNRAFVPHGSHGIWFENCAAVYITNDAYWWNHIGSEESVPEDKSHNITYQHCITLDQKQGHAFRLSGGDNNTMRNCVAAASGKGRDKSGVHWRHGTGVWDFADNTFHNCSPFGVHVWQNQSHHPHPVERATTYHNQTADIDHGAYGNLYHYRGGYVHNNFVLHAKSEEGDHYLTLENMNISELEVTKHQLGRRKEVKVISCQIERVRYTEPWTAKRTSWMQYIDCGLSPSDFVIDSIASGSVIEIIEAGTLQHRFENGVWV